MLYFTTCTTAMYVQDDWSRSKQLTQTYSIGNHLHDSKPTATRASQTQSLLLSSFEYSNIVLIIVVRIRVGVGPVTIPIEGRFVEPVAAVGITAFRRGR